MNFPKKQIIINNFRKVEEYLKGNPYAGEQLSALRLDDNLHVFGVKELLEKIPEGYDQEKMKRFYEETGLRLLVERYNEEYEVTMYDKEGRYPREDAAIWNADFMEQFKNHPEWLEPQEDADILIRYISPIKPEERNGGKGISINYYIHMG